MKLLSVVLIAVFLFACEIPFLSKAKKDVNNLKGEFKSIEKTIEKAKEQAEDAVKKAKSKAE